VHAYLNENINALRRIKGELYGNHETLEDGTEVVTITDGQQPALPPDVAFFFSHAYAVAVDAEVNMSVAVFAKVELGRTVDESWRTRLCLAHTSE
jgi:hypothetical protein